MKRKLMIIFVFMISIIASMMFIFFLIGALLGPIYGLIASIMYFSLSYFSLQYINKKVLSNVYKLIYMSQYNIMLITAIILYNQFYGILCIFTSLILFFLEVSNKKRVNENDNMNKENLFIGMLSLIPITMLMLLFALKGSI